MVFSRNGTQATLSEILALSVLGCVGSASENQSDVSDANTENTTMDDSKSGDEFQPQINLDREGGIEGHLSFEQIEASKTESTFRLSSSDEYLAEFLKQNEEVCFWEVDEEAKTIVALPEPECAATVEVSPSGSDDSQMIVDSAKDIGPGGCVDGGGATFKVDSMKIMTSDVVFKNIKMVPAKQKGGYLVAEHGTDITWIDSPIDFLGRNFQFGHVVEDGAHRTTIVRSGTYNAWQEGQGTLAGIRVRAADDFNATCNTFKDLISVDYPVRGVWYADKDSVGGGIIANNTFENLQATNKAEDSDAICFQGIENRQFTSPMKVLSNVGIDMGKRFIKLQAGNTLIHGNDMSWRTAKGPLGSRRYSVMYSVQGVSNNLITNNIARIEESGYKSFQGYLFNVWNQVFGDNVANVHIDHNRIVRDTDISTAGADIAFWFRGSQLKSKDISFSNNLIEGKGTFNFIYWFANGESDKGETIAHEDNIVTVGYSGLHRKN